MLEGHCDKYVMGLKVKRYRQHRLYIIDSIYDPAS